MFIRFDMTHEREKNRRFHVPQPTFLFPLETPLRLSRNMDGKTIQCLPNPSQYVPIYLHETMLKSIRKSKNRCFYHIFVSHGDAPGAITLNVGWVEREFDAYQLSCSMYPAARGRERGRGGE